MFEDSHCPQQTISDLLLNAFPMPWELNRTLLINNQLPINVNFYKLFKNSGLFRQMILHQPSDYVLSFFPEQMREFEIAVYFCHMEELKITKRNILDSLHASANYQVYQLFQKCCLFIQNNLTVKNAWKYHRAATQTVVHDLEEAVNNFIAKNIVACCYEPGFMSITSEELCKLLQRSDLNVRQERTVVAIIQKWARGDWRSRKNQLQTLVHAVRSCLITSEQIEKFPERLMEECEALEALKTRILAKDNRWMPTDRKRNITLLFKEITEPRMPHEVILMFGGYEHHRISQKSYLFDPRCQLWFTYSIPGEQPLALPHPLMSFAIAISYSRNVIYLVGGEERQNHASQKLQAFYLKERRWELLSPMYDERRDLAVAIIDDDYLLAIGGDNNKHVLQSVEKYLPERRQWIRVQPMLLQRSGLAAAGVGHKVFVFGGYTIVPMHELTNSCEMYNADTNQWTYVTPMRDLRYYIQAIVCPSEDYIYVLGGGDEMFWSTVERYDIQSNLWSTMPSMITQRADFAACLVDGEIFCLGGGNDTSSTCEMESWSVKRSQSNWRRSVPLPVKVWGHRCVCVKGVDIIASLISDQINERNIPRTLLKQINDSEEIEELNVDPFPCAADTLCSTAHNNLKKSLNSVDIFSPASIVTGEIPGESLPALSETAPMEIEVVVEPYPSGLDA